MACSAQAPFRKVGPVTAQVPLSVYKPVAASTAVSKSQYRAGKLLSSACTTGTTLHNRALVTRQSVVHCRTFDGPLFRDLDGNWKFDIEEALLVFVIWYCVLLWLVDSTPEGQLSPSPSSSSYTLESSQLLGQNQRQQQQQYWESLTELARKQDSFQADLLQRQQAFEQQTHASIEALQKELQLTKGRIAEF